MTVYAQDNRARHISDVSINSICERDENDGAKVALRTKRLFN